MAFQPIEVELEAGKTYYWCRCGKSRNQPFCDGSHKGSGIEPRPFKVEESKNYWLCVCKQTANPPFCDGTHNKL
jgi:CDGSH-type Zn-finger protein